MTTKRRLTVTVNGKPFVVEVGSLTDSPIMVRVNDQPFLVRIEAEELDVVLADAAGTPPEPVARQVPIPTRAPYPAAPAGPTVQQVRAPMPGKIMDIAVKPGEQVNLGQQLCALEAMKMKNAIRSSRDGVIATVEVIEGQEVSHSDLLFTFQ